MPKMKLKDAHIKFASEIAAGIPQKVAYQTHIATKKLTDRVLDVNASQLVCRAEIQILIDKFRKERELAMIEQQKKEIAKEFSTFHLTNDQLDSYHCSIIQGLVMVEEIVPVYESNHDEKTGRILRRFASFKSVKRPANIREKQASIDALYKRRAAYPNNYTGMFKRTIEEDSDGNQAEVTRFVMLSNGEKLILP